MDRLSDMITQIECHSVEGIRRCFSEGLSPNIRFRGEPLIYELTSEYTRGPAFKECVQAFVDFGLEFGDPALLAVLLDDADTLASLIAGQPGLVHHPYSLRCAYTPLHDCTLLHICAEFNHIHCARVLLENGAKVNARAGTDAYGFGGQTPVFHTVNQNNHQSAEMMVLLLARGADLSITVKGFLWGKGYDWETLIPAVNPISYAMMGLLPQMHRDEATISSVVSTLLQHAYGIEYRSGNIPNKYLGKGKQW